MEQLRSFLRSSLAAFDRAAVAGELHTGKPAVWRSFLKKRTRDHDMIRAAEEARVLREAVFSKNVHSKCGIFMMKERKSVDGSI